MRQSGIPGHCEFVKSCTIQLLSASLFVLITPTCSPLSSFSLHSTHPENLPSTLRRKSIPSAHYTESTPMEVNLIFISVISGPGHCLENTAAHRIQLSLISFPSKHFSAHWVAFNHLLFIWFSVSGWWFFSSSRKWENILSLRTIISTLSFPREACAGLAGFEYMLHILCLINYHS